MRAWGTMRRVLTGHAICLLAVALVVFTPIGLAQAVGVDSLTCSDWNAHNNAGYGEGYKTGYATASLVFLENNIPRTYTVGEFIAAMDSNVHLRFSGTLPLSIT